MGNRYETPARILDAALACVAARGPAKTSLRDVAEAAGVSRGTLYRYFRNKDELLDAIGEHIRQGVSTALDDAVTLHPAPADRLRVIIEAIVRYGVLHPEVPRVIDAEPAFSLRFLRRVAPYFNAKVATLLEPLFDGLAIIDDGVATREDLAELLIRTTTSMYLIPTDGPDRIVDAIVAFWGAAAIPAAAADRPAARSS